MTRNDIQFANISNGFGGMVFVELIIHVEQIIHFVAYQLTHSNMPSVVVITITATHRYLMVTIRFIFIMFCGGTDVL